MAGGEPPYLPVGTDVSAKYRGAFCEAKVKKIVRSVKCKVALKDLSGSIVVTDDNIKGTLKVGVTVEAKHPESGLFVEGVLNKLTDCSMYTVVFDDADERTLRRTQLCLKGEKHFIESETLDNLPLSHPEHFGTPVMQSSKDKKKRRSLRDTEEEESELSSAESEPVLPKRASYKGKNQDLVGKVMYIEIGDKKKLTAIPVLVVLPDAHNTELRTKDHLLVRSFRDSKYLSVSRRELKEFVRDVALKNEDKAMKNAMEKALLYFDSGEVPAAWNKEELLGYESEVDEGDGEDSSDDEPSEEKDRFVAQLYKFMDDRGTPINKAPSIGSKDLNLYKLFKVVQNIGGYNRVTSMMRWRLVYSKMSLPQSNSASSQIKNAYKKYLHAFEDFYRKLGSTMGTISRPGRSRHNSGRSLYRDNQRKAANDIILSPKERKTPVKEVKVKDGERRSKDTPEQSKPAGSNHDCGLDSVKKELAESFKLEEQVAPRKEEKPSEPKNDKTSERKEDTPSREKRDLRETRERKSAVKEDEEDKKIEEKKETAEDSGKNTRKRMKAIAVLGRKSPRGDDIGKKIDDKIEESGESGKKEERKEDKKEERKEDKKEDRKDLEDKKENRRKPKEKDVKPKIEPEKEEEEVWEEKVEEAVDEESVLPSATKLRVKYGRGRNQKIYEAKVVEASSEDGPLQYLVHYAGWNNRYDEWVRPDRIVQIVDKPESSRKCGAKVKPSTPQSPKGPTQSSSMKKRGRPSSVTPTRTSANEVKTPGSEGRSHSSRSPAPSGPPKNRPTRSNSLETPITVLSHKPRRTRRSSGYTDSTDVQSHASESEESYMSFEERGQDEDDVPDFTETVVKTEVEELDITPNQPVSPKPMTPTNKAPSKPEIKPERQEVQESPSGKEQTTSVKEDKKIEETSKKGTSAVIDKDNSPVFNTTVAQSSVLPPKEKQSQIISALFSTPVLKVTELLQSEPACASNTAKPVTNQVSAPVKEKILPACESTSSEKTTAEVKPTVLAETKTESGSDEDSFSKVPEIVKEGDAKLPRAEVVEFEKPPTLVKAISLTDNSDNQESKESKQRKKTKEGKRGRPPLNPQNCQGAATDKVEATPVSQEKVPEKRPREECVSMERQSDVQVKKERKEEIEEKVFEEKTEGQEIHPKEENEKKKVKKKLKKKHHENKNNTASDMQDSESAKKEGGVKKSKDGSKKLGKGDKLSKKEKKALKKKNKLKENSGEKLKEDDSSNESLMKLVADVLKSSRCLPESPLNALPLPQSITNPASNEPVPSTSSFHSAIPDSKTSPSTSDVVRKPVIPIQQQAQEPPQNDPQPTASSILTENTPPTTPEHEIGDVREEPPDNLQLSIDRAVSRTMAEAELADATSLEKLSAGGESPSGGDGSITSNESGSSGNMPSSESSSNDLATCGGKRKRDAEDGTPGKKKKRSSKRQEKKQAAKVAGSDSEEATVDSKDITIDQASVTSPTQTATTTTTTTTPVLQQRSPRPSKYNFNLEEGKYLEGDRRISFLVDKISEIRKIYMSLKTEVACIDRRRKRHKRKERESESL